MKTPGHAWARAVCVAALAVSVHACGSSPAGPTVPQVAVVAVSPAQGSTFGGTALTITGTNLGSVSSVMIGGIAATAVAVKDTSTITATTAAHAAGPADVVVSTSDGKTGSLTGGFTFVAPSIENAPPVIQSVVAIGSRQKEPAAYADLGETLNVTATVTDNETAASALTYEWSADLGTVSGTGSRVTWTAPRSAGAATLRVKVTEKYTGTDASGLPVPKENTVNGSVAVDVHDEIGEIGGMSRDFLLLFSNSSVPVETVIHNFIDGCGAGGNGKSNERHDTTVNRRDYRIVAYSVGSPRVTVSFEGVSPYRAREADAWAAVDVDWTSQCLGSDPAALGCGPGGTRRDRGIDWVTAHYDPPTRHWWLCDSDYQSTNSTSSIRFRR